MLSSGITKDGVRDLIHAFYEKVRGEPELAPIFMTVIGDDWGPHLEVITRFWTSAMMGSGEYNGNPMAVHLALGNSEPRIEPRHFEIWLRLFRETATEHFIEPVAASFITRAERIAESLQLGMFVNNAGPKITTAR